MLDDAETWVPVDPAVRPVTTKANPYFLRTHRRITISNTNVLRDLLQPTVTPVTGVSLSSCSGVSIGPMGNHSIGVQSRSGDLAFVIRSGPAGTVCKVETSPGRLPEGVRIVSAKFRIDKVGDKCRVPGGSASQAILDFALTVNYGFYSVFSVGAYAMLTGDIPAFSETGPLTNDFELAKHVLPARLIGTQIIRGRPAPLPGPPQSVITYENMSVHGFEDPYAVPSTRLPGVRHETRIRSSSALQYDYLEPFVSYLGCGETLINDHEVALVLNSIIADVPEGVRFP